MESLTSIEKFRPAYRLNSDEVKTILLELDGLKGIVSVNVENDSVHIEYYERLISSGLLRDALLRAGFPFQTENKNPGIFRKFISKLGEENNKEFGGKPPKCCG